MKYRDIIKQEKLRHCPGCQEPLVGQDSRTNSKFPRKLYQVFCKNRSGTCPISIWSNFQPGSGIILSRNFILWKRMLKLTLSYGRGTGPFDLDKKPFTQIQTISFLNGSSGTWLPSNPLVKLDEPIDIPWNNLDLILKKINLLLTFS